MYIKMIILVYIVIVVLIICLMSWYYLKFDTYNIRKSLSDEYIEWLHRMVSDICHTCNFHPQYNLVEIYTITHTEKHSITNKGVIYLVIIDDETGAPFSKNTLVYAVLHELAHILSPSIKHESPFDSIEKRLLGAAQHMGYYDPSAPLESNYVTFDLNI